MRSIFTPEELEEIRKADREIEREGWLGDPHAAECLAELRRQTGMTRPEFAALFGVNPGTITNWEVGRWRFSVDRIRSVFPDFMKEGDT